GSRIRLDSRLLSMGRKKIRVGSRHMETSSAPRRGLDSSRLAPRTGRLDVRCGPLAVKNRPRPFNYLLRLPVGNAAPVAPPAAAPIAAPLPPPIRAPTPAPPAPPIA